MPKKRTVTRTKSPSGKTKAKIVTNPKRAAKPMGAAAAERKAKRSQAGKRTVGKYVTKGGERVRVTHKRTKKK